jgi:hypothetical protein
MIILISGPPQCGKDTAVKFIQQLLPYHHTKHMKLSQPLKAGLRNIFNMNDAEMRVLEEFKDDPDFGYNDVSYRDMQIKLFQSLEKDYGPSILGDIFVRRSANTSAKFIIVSDAGRVAEVEPIIQHRRTKQSTVDDIGLIEVHRPSCSFDNDIREYMPDSIKSKLRHVAVIDNKYDLELYKAQIRRVLTQWGLIDAD